MRASPCKVPWQPQGSRSVGSGGACPPQRIDTPHRTRSGRALAPVAGDKRLRRGIRSHGATGYACSRTLSRTDAPRTPTRTSACGSPRTISSKVPKISTATCTAISDTRPHARTLTHACPTVVAIDAATTCSVARACRPAPNRPPHRPRRQPDMIRHRVDAHVDAPTQRPSIFQRSAVCHPSGVPHLSDLPTLRKYGGA